MAGYNTPSILDQGITRRTANTGPAGAEIFGGKNPPSVNAPWAAPIRPINSVWIDPGRQEEQPTGFFGEGPGSAILQTQGYPGFMFPEWGMMPPPPLPSTPGGQTAPGAGDDLLSSAIKAGSRLLENLAGQGGGSTQTFFGPDVVQQEMDKIWGFGKEPDFNVTGPESPGPEFGAVGIDVGNVVNPESMVPFDFANNSSAILRNSPLTGGGDVGARMGFGATEGEVPFNLTGLSETGTPLWGLSGAQLASDFTGVGSAGVGAEALFPQGSPVAGGSWGSPWLATLIAASPYLAKLIGGKAGEDASRFLSNPAFTATASAALAGPLGFAGGLAMPFILGGMKMFDVGGRERRRARDMETLQGIGQRRIQNMLMSEYNPEMLPFIQGSLGNWDQDLDILQRVANNRRLPSEAYEQVKELIRRSEPDMEKITYRPQVVQFDENERAINLPERKNAQEVPGMSEGEIWRLMTIAAQRELDARNAADQRYPVEGR